MLQDADFETTILFARMAERIGLTLVITLVALIIMVAFWRTMTSLEFTLSEKNISVGSGTLIATPVLVLLALIGLAWVSFSHPVTVDRKNDKVIGFTSEGGGQASLTTDNVREAMGLINCAATREPDIAPADVAEIKFLIMAGNWDNAVWGDPAQFRAYMLADVATRANLTVNSQARTLFNTEHPSC